MKITLESTYGSTTVSASAEVPDIEASGEELEWLVNAFKSLVQEGILNRG